MSELMPMMASEHARDVDQFILILHVLVVAAFVLWASWFVICLFRFRGARNPRADYRGLRSYFPHAFVLSMAIAEAILLIGWSIPFWEYDVNAMAHADEEDAVVIRVIAQQFQWNVHYPGLDGEFGRTDVALVDEQLNSVGIDRDDPAAKDDFTRLNELHLPVGKRVVIYLTTKDMIHSFFLPEFRVKQDAIPDMRIPITFVPTMTTEEFRERTGDADRDFQIACAQLCGIEHFQMIGRVIVETEEEYNAWVEERVEEELEYQQDSWFLN